MHTVSDYITKWQFGPDSIAKSRNLCFCSSSHVFNTVIIIYLNQRTNGHVAHLTWIGSRHGLTRAPPSGALYARGK